MARRRSLSDDWQIVADDNLSVISLSDSEAEVEADVEPAKAQPAKECLINDDVSRIPPVTHRKGVETKPDAETDHSDDGTSSRRSNEDQSGSLENPFKDPSPSQLEDEEAREVAETAAAIEAANLSDAAEEPFDDGSNDVDPVYLQVMIHSLSGVLQHTIHVVRDTTTLGESLQELSTRHCRQLMEQVTKLEPIISGYTKVPPIDGRTLPIDPSLHGWLSGVRVKVVALQAETKRLGARSHETYHSRNRGMRQHYGAYGPQRRRTSSLEGICVELNEYRTKMDDFLPIMRADFDEFQSKNLPVVIGQPADPPAYQQSPSPSHSVPIDIPAPPATSPQPPPALGVNPYGPSSSNWLIRRDLYHLKDTLKRTAERLSHSGYSAKDTEDNVLAVALMQKYGSLADTVGYLVSNHGSDWIDSSAAGGMTFPEFELMGHESIGLCLAQLIEVVGEAGDEKFNEWRSPVYAGRADVNSASTYARRGRRCDAEAYMPFNSIELSFLEQFCLEMEKLFSRAVPKV